MRFARKFIEKNYWKSLKIGTNNDLFLIDAEMDFAEDDSIKSICNLRLSGGGLELPQQTLIYYDRNKVLV